MSFSRELSYDQDIDTVKGIQFSVLGSAEIVQRSVVEITKTDTYNGSEPVRGGLFDPKMGVIEHDKQCETCFLNNRFCPGHFGHIKLAVPVFQPMFQENMLKTLKCVCYKCSSLKLADPNDITKIKAIKNMHKRWTEVTGFFNRLTSTKEPRKCPKCHMPQPLNVQWLREEMRIDMKFKNTDTAPNAPEHIMKEFYANDILEIFKRISVEDMELMGFDSRWNKPENMLMSVLIVPPPAVRPSIIEENGQRREDDLTYKLLEIIKYNDLIHKRVQANQDNKTYKEYLKLLQYHIATMMNNQIPGLPQAQQRNGRKLKSIADRLKKKEGRIRGNLNGKRVDQSARSVITPDPYIGVDEIGMPVRIAMNITIPETVNTFNIAHMQKMVRNGPEVWPGAKYIQREGQIKSLKNEDLRLKEAGELREGDVVFRHVLDGDYTLFNRQPSLHKMSMMGHKIRVMPYQTFRLNPLTCNPYNADFDGDEMNAFQAQSIQSMSELMDLAAVPYMIIAQRNGMTIIEPIQDTMVGLYRLTKPYTEVPDVAYANLQMVNSYFTGVLPAAQAGGLHRGRDVFSAILPPGLFLSVMNKQKELVKIVDSKLQDDGVIDLAVTKASSTGLIPVLFHDYGPREVIRFLDNLQRMVCRWLMMSGFSVGISDLVIDQAVRANVAKTIESQKEKTREKIKKVLMNELVNSSILNNHENFENEMRNVLNDTMKQVSNMTLDPNVIQDKTNRMINMVKSGAKGKDTNVAQMIGCVGQQNIEGKRVTYGFTDRTLPHYEKFDDGAEARGFVENSFITGLSPQEVFFHAMSGREGLINTAVKSVTGDTPIVIIENGAPRYVRIGDWIDARLEAGAAKEIEHHEDRNMELLKIEGVQIPTTDADGNVSWGEVTAVTRHDPGEFLYDVVTAGGKKVTVVESKSLLVWDQETAKFAEKLTSEVKLGDFMPVTKNLCAPPVIISRIGDFELNRNNGIVIGLYMAMPNAKPLEPIPEEFVGLTHIPDVVFAAPDDFVKRLLGAYFTGSNVEVAKNRIMITGEPRMLEGISMLATRFGAFGEVSLDGKMITFHEKSTKLLLEKLEISHIITVEIKTAEDAEPEQQNDVVLDKIVSITKREVGDVAKVYDLTIPSTMNFGLANGLHVYDTSETGYLQRKLVKSMEDCKIYYDRTVRNATGAIVQFLYGEDGMDGSKVENQVLPTASSKLDHVKLDAMYHIRKADSTAMKKLMAPDAHNNTFKVKPEVMERYTKHFEQLVQDRDFLLDKIYEGREGDKMQFPIPFARIINTATERARAAGYHGAPTNLSAVDVLDAIDGLLRELRVQDRPDQGTRFFEMLTRAYLSPKPLIVEKRLSKQLFDWIVGEVRRYYWCAVAQPGEMVGIIAAQTVGENSTQLVLDSFHSSGTVAAVKATGGVPRFKELLSVSKNIKTPILTIHLDADIGTMRNPPMDGDGVDSKSPEYTALMESALRFSKKLQITRLVDLVKKSELYWDPPSAHGYATNIPEDGRIMEVYKNFSDVERNDNLSEWVLRLELDHGKLHNAGLSMYDIYMRISTVYPQISCLFSDDNAEQLIFRIQEKKEKDKKDRGVEPPDVIAALKALEHNLIHTVVLKGIDGIKKVSMNKNFYKERGGDDVLEWIIDTDGTNLKDVLGMEGVDSKRTFSNDVWEIARTLGIEAARNALFNEMKLVVEDGVMNYRHISLLLDTMTNRGRLMSMDRHGINPSEIGPLAKLSFEDTTDMLVEAGMFSGFDKINGVSANIMLGQLPPCGTGECEILLDDAAYRERIGERIKKTAEAAASAAVSAKVPGLRGLSDVCAPANISLADYVPTQDKKDGRRKIVRPNIVIS